MDDVIVVGAGPAGCMAAIIVARAGFRVRMFDRARFPRAKLCGDTINPGAYRTLARHLHADRILRNARPIDGMLLTGPGGIAVRGFYGSRERRQILGFAIERKAFDQRLLEAAVASGASLEDNCVIDEAVVEDAIVTGVRVRGTGTARTHRARQDRAILERSAGAAHLRPTSQSGRRV